MHRAVMIAFTSPTSDATDADYNAWYDGKHLHEVAAIDGVVRASRYQIVHDLETLPGVTGPTQKYMAIYELAATSVAELDEFCERLRQALADGSADIDVTLDTGALGATIALPIGQSLVGRSA